MNTKQLADQVRFGAEPRMDLLPPEVRIQKKIRATRRRLAALLVIALLAVGTGVAASTGQALLSQERLAVARERTAELVAAQAQYSEVQEVQNALDTTLAAQQFGASTEIDWKAYLAQIQALLPSDVGVASFTLDSATPFAVYDQPTSPLLGSRLATVNMLFTSPSISGLPDWLQAMSALPGYADSHPTLISRTVDGTYTVAWVLHLNQGALSERFSAANGN
ncbi:hypothetical protein [Cryobacterium sp. CG_9.6]|uniref:hypothetical protein n=1 Tax=Cryobacterium sp. CG_9.6 TaxID=2760710 RepID=UPI0024743610|nr:hypothetical protein [Cryobacterium sp. CG_9.6]MDH6238058.1 hypothetical protein [Cryobacterium sp. CG_9.6]